MLPFWHCRFSQIRYYVHYYVIFPTFDEFKAQYELKESLFSRTNPKTVHEYLVEQSNQKTDYYRFDEAI